MSEKPLVLVVDDERHAREGLARALRRDYRIALARDGASALEAVASERPDIVLSDLRMPGIGGMELLRRLRGMENPPVFILLTAYGSIETAVEAMRRGAFDFLPKPVDLDRLEALLSRAVAALPKPAAPAAPLPVPADDAIPGLLGRSEAMRRLSSALRKAAASRATVLLQGESGTGKEVAARAIHALSARASGPFVAVHCAALTPSLLESELFGHEKGAYTDATARTAGRFERADGGTLFLDEIGEIDAATQVKILRVLEERAFERVGGTETVKVDVRLIAATNRDLARAVAEGRFREDLFYRLYVINLTLPPLRERTEDLPELCAHFLGEAAKENGVPAKTLAPETEGALAAYPWPGNVREVRNLMERLTVLAEHDPVLPEDLPDAYRSPAAKPQPVPSAAVPAASRPAAAPSGGKPKLSREALEAALAANGGNRTRAAAALGVSRRTVIRAIERYERGTS